MNYAFILRQLGRLLAVLSGIILVIWLWSIIRWSLDFDFELAAQWALLATAGLGALLGYMSWLLGTHLIRPKKNLVTTGASSRKEMSIGRREALLLVAIAWVVVSLLAALPYLLWSWIEQDNPADHPFNSYVNCFFESISGLSTTGASVLTDIEAMPHSLLLWRALTQWLGGLGIVVLFVAVLPMMGVGGKRLFRIEAPGPDPEGVRPHIRETARILWLIYTGMTVALIVALLIAGMSLFDAVCHAFTTVATGGFSNDNSSLGGYRSATIDIITMLFMVLASANFILYFAAARGKFSSILRDTELRVYVGVIIIGVLLIAGTLWVTQTSIITTEGVAIAPTAGASLLYGSFTAISQQTTTGFTVADFSNWPFLATATIIGLMFIGGSAGSTAGGIKIARIWIGLRVILGEVERVFRPNVVRPLKVSGTTIDEELKLGTLAYLVLIVLLFISGAILMMLFEGGNEACSFATASSASLATLCTVGPGLGAIGALDNYNWMTDASKLLLCLWMTLGRLEIFTLLVLLSPRFWSDR
ncbi:MAG: TrkH family potassium uptake protein [Phycisphaerales bacterium]|nr:TrkH family potassium uptake protein [Phycisphaerales bacterium]